MALHCRKREKTVPFLRAVTCSYQPSGKESPTNTGALSNAKICHFLLVLQFFGSAGKGRCRSETPLGSQWSGALLEAGALFELPALTPLHPNSQNNREYPKLHCLGVTCTSQIFTCLRRVCFNCGSAHR